MFRLIRHSAWSLPRYFSFKNLISQHQPVNRYVTKAPEPTVLKSKAKKNSGEIQSKTSQGEVIYRYETTRYYLYANVFVAVLLLNAVSYGHYFLSELKELDSTKTAVVRILYYGDVEYNEKRFRKTFVFLLIFIAGALAWTVMMNTLRSVKALALLKDKTVAVVTYSPFSRHRILKVPLDHITGIRGRTPGVKSVHLKIKGKRIPFSVDLKNGHFENVKLFDTVINVKRDFQ